MLEILIYIVIGGLVGYGVFMLGFKRGQESMEEVIEDEAQRAYEFGFHKGKLVSTQITVNTEVEKTAKKATKKVAKKKSK